MRRLAIVSILLVGSAAHADRKEKEKEEEKEKEKPKVKVSGFLTVLYKFRIDQDGDGTTEPDVFRLGKSRIRVRGRLTDQVGYTVEADPRSPTVIGMMRDAYISLHVIPRHEIRLGQQKTQFGWENRESSTRLYTITRTELSESLGRGITLRDIGVGVLGDWKLGGGWRIEDAVTVVNGSGLGVQADDTQLKNVWGRVGMRFKHDPSDLVVRFGVSGAIGDQMDEEDLTADPPELAQRRLIRRVGADAEVDHPWFFAAVEFAAGFDRVPAVGGELDDSIAYSALVAGKTKWHVGPVVRYDAFDADEWTRITAGAYYGEPDDRVRAFLHYEYFADDAADPHDGRVMAMGQVRF